MIPCRSVPAAAPLQEPGLRKFPQQPRPARRRASIRQVRPPLDAALASVARRPVVVRRWQWRCGWQVLASLAPRSRRVRCSRPAPARDRAWARCDAAVARTRARHAPGRLARRARSAAMSPIRVRSKRVRAAAWIGNRMDEPVDYSMRKEVEQWLENALLKIMQLA